VSSALSSPRLRRRLAWTGGLLVVVGAVTFSMVHWSNTSHYRAAKTRPGTPQIVRPPVHVAFAPRRKQGVLRIAAEFVDTAVKRKHVGRSFDLVTPNMRSGYTRHTWATQDIPVQPYPLDIAKYKVKGSFADEIWLQVAAFPDRAHRSVPAAVFDLVLKPVHGRWLVDSWAPAGYQDIPSGPLGGSPNTTVIDYKSGISQWWVFAPVSAFALGLVLLASVALRGWWRGQRAVKRYKSTYL
jgi:hypothetical protein